MKDFIVLIAVIILGLVIGGFVIGLKKQAGNLNTKGTAAIDSFTSSLNVNP